MHITILQNTHLKIMHHQGQLQFKQETNIRGNPHLKSKQITVTNQISLFIEYTDALEKNKN